MQWLRDPLERPDQPEGELRDRGGAQRMANEGRDDKGGEGDEGDNQRDEGDDKGQKRQ